MDRSATPLVVFGDDWGRHVSSMQHLLRHVFPRYPTVWVNALGHRTPAWSDLRRAWEKLRAPGRLSQPATDHFAGPVAQPDVVINPRVLPWHHWPLIARLNAASLERAIRAALRPLGGGRPIVVTGSPPSVTVHGRLDERATIYFCMDDFAHLPGVSRRMVGLLERRLLDRADAVVATARALTELKHPRGGVAYYLPQGVNYEHFAARRPTPLDLSELPRPRIGFAGGVGPALDLAILHELAAAFPDGSVVLVGPAQAGLGALQAANIHHLGPRPYADLPAYVQSFDVGIIPYVRNPWTESVDPLKLLEYLAAGIPVVTTDLPEVHKYVTAVTIAPSAAEFVTGVRRAVAAGPEGGRAARQAVAAANSWASRAEEFVGILHRFEGVPPARPLSGGRV